MACASFVCRSVCIALRRAGSTRRRLPRAASEGYGRYLCLKHISDPGGILPPVPTMTSRDLPQSAAWEHRDSRRGFEVVFLSPPPHPRADGHTAAVEGQDAWTVEYL